MVLLRSYVNTRKMSAGKASIDPVYWQLHRAEKKERDRALVARHAALEKETEALKRKVLQLTCENIGLRAQTPAKRSLPGPTHAVATILARATDPMPPPKPRLPQPLLPALPCNNLRLECPRSSSPPPRHRGQASEENAPVHKTGSAFSVVFTCKKRPRPVDYRELPHRPRPCPHNAQKVCRVEIVGPEGVPQQDRWW